MSGLGAYLLVVCGLADGGSCGRRIDQRSECVKMAARLVLLLLDGPACARSGALSPMSPRELSPGTKWWCRLVVRPKNVRVETCERFRRLVAKEETHSGVRDYRNEGPCLKYVAMRTIVTPLYLFTALVALQREV